VLSLESLLQGTPRPVILAESGLGGRLDVRTPRGGCGKAFTLIVFRIVFPAPLTPGVALSFGRLFGGDEGGSGVLVLEGARRPLFGKGVENPAVSTTVGIPPVLFLVLVVGIAGKAEVGGP
jgi:hypothetical protein